LITVSAAVPLVLDATKLLRVADATSDADLGPPCDVAASVGLPPTGPDAPASELLTAAAGGLRRLRLPGRVAMEHLPLSSFRSVPSFLATMAARQGIVAFVIIDGAVGLLLDPATLCAGPGQGSARG
jgi:hypothetical protein